MEMEKETVKLLNVLRRIARAAGYAAWVKSDSETARFCVSQYNKILARLSELEPALKPLFVPLAEDSSAEVTRLAARELLAYFEPDAPEFAWGVHVGYRRHGCHSRRSRVGYIPLSVSCE
jgi:hypothetical protein